MALSKKLYHQRFSEHVKEVVTADASIVATTTGQL